MPDYVVRRAQALLNDHKRAVNGSTVLVYGHYDVQPVDPLNLWKTPPFEPSVRPSNKVKGAKDLYARGAADDTDERPAGVRPIPKLASCITPPCPERSVCF